jgi:NAD(P)H-hydrate epimerase
MRRIDEAAALVGRSGRALMSAAGRAVADVVLAERPDVRRIAVLCGRGNNGGDGHVVARLLAEAGIEVDRFELGPATRPDAASARAEADAALGPARPLTPGADLDRALTDSDLIVDALFGSGLARPLEGVAAAAVAAIGRSATPTVAVDVPSGVDADRALASGPHVRAMLTVELAGASFAGVLPPVREAFGRRVVAGIGVPPELLALHADGELLTAERLRPHLPRRPIDAHKYGVGTVLVVAGSPRYLGAAELACRAAYRGGAGLVTLAAAERYPGGWPEVVLQPLGPEGAAAALRDAGPARSRVLVIGPGLDGVRAAEIADLLDAHPGDAVLDAGALQPDGALRDAVRSHGRCLLTPHHGEAARLLERTSDDVRSDPVGAALTLARSWGAKVALKGAVTLLADPTGTLLLSDRGHPGMAVGGSGDALAGLLGAWLGTGDPLWRAAAAIYLHGLAGELAAERFGDGLLPSDLIAAIPTAKRSIATDA